MAERPQLLNNQSDLLITFIYYKDLQKGIDFYQDTLGFSLAIDQGWCKIYQISKSGYLGIVDEAKGMQNWHADKTVQICIRVPDVMAWFDYCKSLSLPNQSDLFVNDALKIKAFVCDDPEGYQVEFQESITNDLLI
jgi:hypothetical protein